MPTALSRRSVLGGMAYALLASTAAVGLASNYARCIRYVLKSEGANDDDPRDPGGRTSRGIIQREWSAWRKTHPGLPADVWQAPQDQIEAIYRQKYWDALRCDALPSGLDYTIFDYGVNSGIGRAGKVLRKVLGLPATDWRVTDEVLAAIAKRPAAKIISAINDERLRFLKSLHHWPTYGKGWGRRVASVKGISLAMAGVKRGSLGSLPLYPRRGPGKGIAAIEDMDQ